MNVHSQSHGLVSDAVRAAQFINEADALVIAAGAGIGVDSGLPDFRGEDGFWKVYPALGRARTRFSEIASPEAFQLSPLRAWGFYGHRIKLYRDTKPHAGFDLLRRWGESMSRGHFVFTSNVDGQFQKAGFDHRKIVECHGSIHHFQCLEPCSTETWPADGFEPDVDTEACRLRNDPPACAYCRGPARPNVLMFGDVAWCEWRTEMQIVRMEEWLGTIQRPVVIEVGAGSMIPSVRRFSHRMIQEFDARLIRINPGEAAVPTNRHVAIATGALAGLQMIAAVLDGNSGARDS
jgi:NAD-dependent SIR2 family protein deacetylase